MTNQSQNPAFARVLLRLELRRLLLALVLLGLVVIVGGGYLGEQALEREQHQRTYSIARMVDRHLEQAGRTLDAVALVAETSTPENLAAFMQSTWKAYGYFETIYGLDKSDRIKQLAPPDPRYLGLDVSSIPYWQPSEGKNSLFVSRPFMSFRTGSPTAYLVRPLSRGGRVVGELNLGWLQDEITGEISGPGEYLILDQSGMLLAHPSPHLVKQQPNLSHLEIFRRGLERETTLLYDDGGTMVLGHAVRAERAGWVIVAQVPLLACLGPYAWPLGLMLLASMTIWLALAWNLRAHLRRHVVAPLVQLSEGTSALGSGDFGRGAAALASIPVAFAELDRLTADFQHMSKALQTRQAALQESEERHRAMVEAFDGLIYVCSQDYQVEFMNKRLVERTGYNGTGEPCYKVLHERDTVCPWCVNERVFQGETVRWEVESPKDNRWYYVVNTPIHHADGSISKQAMIMDVTERKRAEQALHESERRFRAIFDQTFQFIGLMTVDGTLIEANRTALEFSGVEESDVIGKPFWETPWWIHSHELQEKLRAGIKRASDGEFVRFEATHAAADGSLHYVDFSLKPVTDESGNAVLLIPEGRDITERRRAEEEVRRLNAELEERVVERTAQLETANRELESFSYSVSHDLRAPLRGIDGWSLALLEDCWDRLDERGREHLKRVRHEAQRMGMLIDDLLELSRVTRADMTRERVDLSDLARSIAERLRNTEPGRKVEFVIHQGLMTYGDTRLLEVMLANLLENAWKFTGKHASARIEFGRTEIEGKTVYFVGDDGAGFDMAYAGKLFGGFQRMHSPSEFPGTGIGLASVQRIIHRHGGRVWAEAEVEKGATFYFTL
jgi:PAS domain S-box-containing protein